MAYCQCRITLPASVIAALKPGDAIRLGTIPAGATLLSAPRWEGDSVVYEYDDGDPIEVTAGFINPESDCST